jgi:O-antigen ligase
MRLRSNTGDSFSSTDNGPATRTASLLVLLALALYCGSVYLHVSPFYFTSLLGFCVLAAALVRFDVALLFIPLVLANPYRLTGGDSFLVSSEIILLIVFLVWFLRSVIQPSRLILPRVPLFLGLVVIGSGIASLLVAKYPAAGILQVVKHVEILLLLFVMIVNSLTGIQSVRRFVWAFLIGGFIASLVGLVPQLFGGQFERTLGRVYGLLGGGYGAVMASTLLMSLSIIMFSEVRIEKVVASIVAPFVTLALLLSQTRGWVVAFAFGLIPILFKAKRFFVWATLGTVVTLIVVGVLSLRALDSAQFSRRLAQTSTGEDAIALLYQGSSNLGGASMVLRLNVWSKALTLFLDHPITGIGFGNLRFGDYLLARLAPPAENAGFVDNQYLHVLVEGGIFAGLAWLAYVVYILLKAQRTVIKAEGTSLFAEAIGVQGTLIVYGIGGMFWTITPSHEQFALMISIFALLIGISRVLDNAAMR